MFEKMSIYPFALLAIIGGAFYFLFNDLMKPGGVDYTQYQAMCEQYQAAAPGAVSREELQMLIYKVNYLLPDPAANIIDPVQKAVKTCAQSLSERLPAQDAAK